jgi:DNA-binding transcriptional MerR regulator
MGKALTIGSLAKRVGTRPSAIRFYERQGLLAPQRLPNGYRVYDPQPSRFYASLIEQGRLASRLRKSGKS